jgi:hypothetical protein
MIVIGMPVQHEMHVHVPEAGQHAHPVGGDDLCARRNCDLAAGASGNNPLAVNDDDGVTKRRSTIAVDERAAGDGEDACRLSE